MKQKFKVLLALMTLSFFMSHQARGDDSASNSSITGQYWFDQSNERSSFIPGPLEISTSTLAEGLHSLNAYVQDSRGTTSTIVSKWFIKTLTILPGLKYKTIVFVDGKPFQTFDNQISGYGILSFPMDMNTVPIGIHTLQVQVVSPNGITTDMKQTLFMRVPATTQLSTLKGYYTIDGKYAGELSPTVNDDTYHFDIDASNLISGIHSISVYMASPVGLTTTMQTAWFIKTPQEGEGVKSYEYWINDYSTSHQVTLEKVANPMQLVSLIEVPEQPFRTSSYTFSVEDGEPVIYPLNQFYIRFIDPDGRITSRSTSYTDTRDRQRIEQTKTIQAYSNVFTETIPDNNIKWYSFEGEIGDSVATRLSDAGMLELYGPDGSTLLAHSGVDATTLGTTTLKSNGTHYLAVHDIQKSSKKTDIFFDHIPRFAICSFSPENCASNDMLLVNVVGNGFDNLKEVRIVGDSGSYESSEIVKDGNNYLYLLFKTDTQISKGKYNIVCVFNDTVKGIEETVTSQTSLTISEAHAEDVVVEIKDSNINQIPYITYVKVTNPGNVPYYCVPFNVAVPDFDGSVYFVGFPQYEIEDVVDNEWSIFGRTQDILGTGKPGSYVNAVIPYLGPGETRSFSLAFVTSSANEAVLYAWCDRAWSEQLKDIMSDDYDYEQILTPSETNFLTVRDIAHTYWNILNQMEVASISPSRAPSNSQAVNAANAAFGTTKKAVEIGAHGAMNPIATHQLGNKTLQEMTGGNEAVAQMINTDGGMLHVGEALIDASGTSDNMMGNAKFIAGLGEARKRWQDAIPPKPMPTPHTTSLARAWDPNEMFGYTSPSGDNFIGLDIKKVEYTIEFENDPEMANASATRINVSNTLDPNIFDLSTLKAEKMIIGNKETELPADHHFVKTLDMRPEINSIAELTFDFDADQGKASWSIRTLDPITLEPTRYMDDGILPVNDDTGRGIGFLTYSINLNEELPDGSEIKNKAVIVFDDNDPIETPTYINLTDYSRPESKIRSHSIGEDGSHTFEFESSDSGSGIWYYDLYMRPACSTDWILVKAQIEENTITFTPTMDTEGCDWTTVAIDRAGNIQSASPINALCGDADANGLINATDVVVIRNHYMDTSVEINKANADVNADGVINAQDAIITRNLYLGEATNKNS